MEDSKLQRQESDVICSVFSDHKATTAVITSVELCFSVVSQGELVPSACLASTPL